MKHGRRAGFRGALTLPLASVLLLCACAKLAVVATSEPPPPPAVSAFELAVAMMEHGSFSEAEKELRQVASTCESGVDGRRSLMLLAAMSLDPRNPHADADSAAVLAARYLFLPSPDPSERLVAESLYTLALDLGADPALRPTLLSGPGLLAPRFSDCEVGDLSVDAVPGLPSLGRESRAATFHSLLLKRDSLQARMARSEEDARNLQAELQTTQAELQIVQSEMQRIRRLLGAPDTTRTRPNGL